MVKAYVKEIVAVSDGVYDAKIEDIEEKDNRWYNPKKSEEYEMTRLCVTFKLTLGETTEKPTIVKITKYMTPVITPLSVLYGLISAVLGKGPDLSRVNVYEEVGWLVGKKVKVVVKSKKDSEDREWVRITDFLPYGEKEKQEEETVDPEEVPF